MRAVKILVLVSVFYAGLRPACSTRIQDGHERPVQFNGWELQRKPRSTDNSLMEIVKDAYSRMLGLPRRMAETAVAMIRLILSRIGGSIRWFLSPVQRLLNDLPRGKRELALGNDLISFVEEVAANPVKYLQRSFDGVESSVRANIETFLENALSYAIRFMSTTGLVWIHNVLNRIDKLPGMPDGVHQMTKSFDTFYNILELLGYVGSSN